MDGHAITETALSLVMQNKDSRADSQFWTTIIPKNPKYIYKKIGELVMSSQYGISVDMNTEEEGYPIFRMNEIHDMLTDLTVDKYAKISAKEYSKFTLEDGDVLFNRTNSYEWVGRTGVYYKNDDKPFTYASYLVKLVADRTKMLPECLTAYLSCKYGVWAIKARARQSINQTNVNPEELKEIEMPLFSMDFQNKIRDLFIEANRERVISKEYYQNAEQILNDILLVQYSNDSISIKSLSLSFLFSGRLDAEYYQPKYDDITKILNTRETVRTLCNVYDKNFEPEKTVQYNYIELANVGSSGDITGSDKNYGIDLPSRARRVVHKGQVIVSSIEGSLSSCALITDEFDGALCSTGFYVIDSEKINSETLLILFKSNPIQMLLKQRCSGTILTAISKEEFLNMPLPYIDDSIQQQIAEKVQESFRLREQSKRLLDNAVKAVEMAIETDEKSALLWLEMQN